MTEKTLHIIHDRERVDRRELLMREIAQQEIFNYMLWDAIFDDRAPFAGISMAHKRIVRYAKQNRWPRVTIGEDDIRFTCHGAWKHYVDTMPEDYDIYLGGVYTGDVKEDQTVEDFSGMTLYTVHERFYDKFLEVPILNHIDRALARLGRYVVCKEFVAIQWTTWSKNKGAMVDHSPLLTGRRLYNGGR